MSKLEGYYMGTPMYSNPECQPDLLYVVNDKQFAINFPLRKDGNLDMRYKINKFERAFNQMKARE